MKKEEDGVHTRHDQHFDIDQPRELPPWRVYDQSRWCNLYNHEPMKPKIIKCIVSLMILLLSLPMMGQDLMEVYFKDGLIKNIYLDGLKEWKVSQYDTDGVKHADYKYQHIKTNIHDFVFDLEKIDSIVFTKFDEKKVKQPFCETMKAVIPILS